MTARMDCIIQVHACEHREDIGLKESHQEFETGQSDRHGKRQDRSTNTDGTKGAQRSNETCEDFQRDVASKHVGEKTN